MFGQRSDFRWRPGADRIFTAQVRSFARPAQVVGHSAPTVVALATNPDPEH